VLTSNIEYGKKNIIVNFMLVNRFLGLLYVALIIAFYDKCDRYNKIDERVDVRF